MLRRLVGPVKISTVYIEDYRRVINKLLDMELFVEGESDLVVWHGI